MPRSPRVDWRLLLAVTVFLLALTFALGTVIIWRSQTEDRALIRDLRASNAESIESQQCRALYAVAVTDAQVDWQVAFGELLKAVAARSDSREAVHNIDQADSAIRTARDAQAAYAAAPRLPCPIGD